jgi:hypothetical protein
MAMRKAEPGTWDMKEGWSVFPELFLKGENEEREGRG